MAKTAAVVQVKEMLENGTSTFNIIAFRGISPNGQPMVFFGVPENAPVAQVAGKEKKLGWGREGTRIVKRNRKASGQKNGAPQMPPMRVGQEVWHPAITIGVDAEAPEPTQSTAVEF